MLYERWEDLSSARQVFAEEYEKVRREALRDHADLEDRHRLDQLRATCREWVENLKDADRKRYRDLVSFVGFIEMVGVYVRNGYVPMRDVVQMYKGPILDADTMFRKHIEHWQKEAHMPDGLFENALYLMKRARRRERLKTMITFSP